MKIFKTIIFFFIVAVFEILFILLFNGWTKPSLFSKIISMVISLPSRILNINYTNSNAYIDLLVSPLFYSIMFFLILLFKSYLKNNKGQKNKTITRN
jgi:uncharacterized membrane protein YjjP (DUF1212 family)